MDAMLRKPLLEGSVLDEQISTELDAVQRGVDRYRRLEQEAVKRGDGAGLKPAERVLLYWLRPLIATIKQQQRRIRRGKYGPGFKEFGHVLCAVPADRVAVATLHHVIGSCMVDPDGVKFIRIVYGIGRAVIAEAHYDDIRHDPKATIKDLSKRLHRLTPRAVNRYARKNLADHRWSMIVCIRMGTWLYWTLAMDALATSGKEDPIAAFHHQRRYTRNRQMPAFVRMDDRVFQLIESGHMIREIIHPRYSPMIVQPYPWSDKAEGGYVRIRTPFISRPTQSQNQAIKAADLTQIYDCLNALNSTPMRINQPMLDLIEKHWENGGGSMRVPLRDDLPMPSIPHDFKTNPEAKKNWKAAAFDIHIERRALRGERISFLSKLSVAQEFAERDRIWFPYQFDFRGRTYPIPSHLNHQGDDAARGLLELGDAIEPGKRGREWLKIHLANCFGIDRVSFEERIRWVEASDLDWTQAEKPWQALAAMKALEDPESARHAYVSMDGTCNGLQHYAAMSQDKDLAVLVNIIPSDHPSDVYSDVSEATIPRVAADAERGKKEARWVVDLIDRTLVKQTVMTNVYGVTMVGARHQIQARLKDVGFEEERLYAASAYLSAVVRSAIGEVCKGADEIMEWLKVCAKLITTGKYADIVRWTTPLGLPVIQPYRKHRIVEIRTIAQRVSARVDDDDIPVKSGEQISGVAPNFVHSIDATHMLMTARACREEGIAFVPIHDAFWTHAESVDQMNRIIREQFVRLHSQPILENLRSEWTGQYPWCKFPPIPKQGNLDLSVVLVSQYFFS